LKFSGFFQDLLCHNAHSDDPPSYELVFALFSHQNISKDILNLWNDAQFAPTIDPTKCDVSLAEWLKTTKMKDIDNLKIEGLQEILKKLNIPSEDLKKPALIKKVKYCAKIFRFSKFPRCKFLLRDHDVLMKWLACFGNLPIALVTRQQTDLEVSSLESIDIDSTYSSDNPEEGNVTDEQD